MTQVNTNERPLLPECELCGEVLDEIELCELCGCGDSCCCKCDEIDQDDEDVVELAGWIEIPGGLEDEDEPHEPKLDDIDRELYLDTIGA